MLLAGCTSAKKPVIQVITEPTPHPKIECVLPERKKPETNADLLRAIDELEHALEQCSSKVLACIN
ncbi:Rz1-like lysis system protein LysC [Pseudomonas sp. F1_0610]|uniref:Rz1-like lysis system protein LysC n=1 Tax=Pseudomonas sp. F1_0610 TaxID=3114284 RepID=UPI0039C1DC66